MTNLTLIYGDALKVLPKLEDESVDLVLTDPPYGINLKAQRVTSKFKDKNMFGDDNLSWLPSFSKEIYRISKNAMYCFCDYRTLGKFQTEFENVGFEIKNVLVWNKMWFGLGNNFRPIYELIILATKDTFTTQSNNLSNILNFKRISSSRLNHIAEKPLELIELLIKESTKKDDLVLDSFIGSGTTMKASLELNRGCIGIEKEKRYIDTTKKRLNWDSSLNPEIKFKYVNYNKL